ncbi:MAG: 1-deoxy-D-xylulose-5-phosphate synthase [Alphaproteobacteria bacterium]|nr:1-deoxy-D-xylulose-5-phosphate synthase [Alphaproteobacteria bacterium]
MFDYEVLNKINSPADVKKLNAAERKELAAEMRAAILNRVSKIGGHLGPNLGTVELAIALHTVFDSPKDKIILDVSHQSYPHKLLTGRRQGFQSDEHFRDISGYTNPQESEHDVFIVGHTSTSVSLAAGLVKARDMQGQKFNVIAVIGDGSLSGGEAFEGLDNAGDFKSNFIVIVNDNEMSIAENYGGLYGNLAELRASNGQSENNYFKSLGFDYRYVADGNDTEALIAALEEVKDITRPVVIHVHTLKGKGYALAEQNKERFHWSLPFNIQTGELTVSGVKGYGAYVAEYLDEQAAHNDKLAVINAGTPGALALQGFRAKYPEKYFDVGIAEEHAVAFSSAMAKGGMKPVALFFGGFIQRAYDQLSQDLCLNKSPAVLVIEGCGITGMDMTHLSVFDIPLLSSIPNLVYLAPSCVAELKRMLDWAMAQTDFPVAIRTPASAPQNLTYAPKTDIVLNKFEVIKQGSKVAFIGLGSMLSLAEKTAEKLAEKGVDATIVNPRFANGLDEELLTALLSCHDVVVTLEDGVLAGGFGEKVAGFYGDKAVKVYNFGAAREFTDRVPVEELYHRYGLTPEQIVQKILG